MERNWAGLQGRGGGGEERRGGTMDWVILPSSVSSDINRCCPWCWHAAGTVKIGLLVIFLWLLLLLLFSFCGQALQIFCSHIIDESNRRDLRLVHNLSYVWNTSRPHKDSSTQQVIDCRCMWWVKEGHVTDRILLGCNGVHCLSTLLKKIKGTLWKHIRSQCEKILCWISILIWTV